MANWVTHLRIAEAVLNRLNLPVDIERYFVGSIATDCGAVFFNANGKRAYNPPRHITHWTDDVHAWDVPIHYERFYDIYIRDESSFDKKSFYIGYYVHLITDAIWIELVSRPVVESFKTREEYAEKARSQFRADRFDTELVFLVNNPEFKPLKLLKCIKNFDNIYLDYFPQKAIQTKIDEIVKTYDNFCVNINRAFPYFSYDEYEHMIKVTTRLIAMSLSSR